MQIFALDSEGNAVEASKALRHTDYSCLECGAKLRVRRSPFLVPHYYHYQSSQACALKKKTLIHLNLQLQLKKRLNAKMEVPFPQIKRIADILHGKTVFEIQVSPISKEEVEERIRDYRSLGLNIVWILYDKTFNKTHVTPAEAFLQNHPHYFTDGTHIYDQISLIRRHKRYHRLFSRRVDLAKACLPKSKFGRDWEIGFENDILSSTHFNPREAELYEQFYAPRKALYFLNNLWKYFLLKACK